MNIAFRYAARSDTGRVRSKNDDSAYAGRYLAVVADGMGGHVGGNVASASTVLDLTPLDRSDYDGDAGTFLADEIQTANIILNQLVKLNPLLAGMGTTCTALLVDGDELELAHIGDSRAYRLRGDTFEQITTDHTFVQRLVEEGRLRPEDAENHPHKNVIMRVLGDTDASPELELKRVDAQVGDRWLLCSDGLSGVVSDEVIKSLLGSSNDLQHICESLVELTLDGGAPDNVTIAIVEVNEASNLANAVTSRLDAVGQDSRADEHQEGVSEEPQPEGMPASAGVSAIDDSGNDVRDTDQEWPKFLDEDSSTAPWEEENPETGASDISQDDSDDDPVRAPWRRRLPRQHGGKPGHTLRHGRWRGDSFSDSVLNVMTQRSGMDLEEAQKQDESTASVLRRELSERPHLLVGAAASATHTGQIPTVTDSTVQRRATLARTTSIDSDEGEEIPDELLEEMDHPNRHKRRWGLALFIWAFIVVLLAGAAWAGLAWVNNQYYVGENDGKVAIYRGVDQSLGPIHLNSIEQDTDVKVKDLPEYSKSRVTSGIHANSVDEAKRIISDLSLDKDSTSARPTPHGTVSSAAPSSNGQPSNSSGSGGDGS
ncbi:MULTISPECIES: PP2C family protein-serine/threonine phosphatase [Kocuria]|uniref:PP2C family protein-serine/threonine phosphatase n=1 Tax=Kocuria TaxID=57493 RepID=UPI000660328B|nr:MULTISPECIES: PP2C family serine/threonine-protein phosphatase [Kocuria]MCT1366974.1 protein phosphatase 2C domain-containing protein [Rothia sp. p3-SID1597]RUQ19859.1 serine/threonine-protein phosphatase [Kocuria sp. HSID16901]